MARRVVLEGWWTADLTCFNGGLGEIDSILKSIPGLSSLVPLLQGLGI